MTKRRSAFTPKPGALVNAVGDTLPNAVNARFGHMLCPCCRRIMSNAKPKRFQSPSPAKMTVGHDVAVARGGHPGGWYWQCNSCNNDQGSLDLVTWGRKLVYADDPRAPFVVETATFVRSWVARWAEERRLAS